MGFQYKQVLMIGGTAGIGAAMADRLIQEGSKVIVVGRRQDRLDSFVEKHGSDKAGSIQFDLSDTDGIENFVSTTTQKYPDIDCVFLNAGVQRPSILSDPVNMDLAVFHMQMSVNFTALVNLTMKFLPFLLNKKSETSLIYTGTNVAIVPAFGLSAYSASKGALNVFVLCLREELKDSSVKVIEISPPVVQTEIHDYMGAEKGRQFGMPIDAFTDVAYKGIISGKDQIIIGSIGPADIFNEIVDRRRTAFEDMAKLIRAHHS